MFGRRKKQAGGEGEPIQVDATLEFAIEPLQGAVVAAGGQTMYVVMPCNGFKFKS